ncbi:hypothetical protein CU254_42580 (plasmid) [Amycolatopsis sp. AA4]|uniref:hypothetical protein n=1 Tax=Amycolatopsis sp. AA4 TaxID=1896961 RepID=UPI000C21BCBF|nr:hypothetical protein [Amycolatopsis sp. AA4]ATY17274.1 hypothetical protein CU254_42580 [Amycolatopsis sp. AA4]
MDRKTVVVGAGAIAAAGVAARVAYARAVEYPKWRAGQEGFARRLAEREGQDAGAASQRTGQ